MHTYHAMLADLAQTRKNMFPDPKSALERSNSHKVALEIKVLELQFAGLCDMQTQCTGQRYDGNDLKGDLAVGRGSPKTRGRPSRNNSIILPKYKRNEMK